MKSYPLTKRTNAVGLLIAFLLCCSLGVACKSKEDKQATSNPSLSTSNSTSLLGKIKNSAKGNSPASLSNASKSLYAQVPDNAIGAIHFDFASKGFSELLEMNWDTGQNQSNPFEMLNLIGVDLPSLLAQQGHKLSEPSDIPKITKQVIAYAAPTSADLSKGEAVIIFEGAKGFDVAKFGEALITSFKNNKASTVTVESESPSLSYISVQSTKALSDLQKNASLITKNLPPEVAAQVEASLNSASNSDQKGKSSDMKIGWNDQLMVVASKTTSKENLVNLLAGKTSGRNYVRSIPAELRAGWGSDEDLYLTGFADVAKMAAAKDPKKPDVTSARYASLASWVDKKIFTDLRVTWDKDNAPATSNFRLLKNSTPSSSLGGAPEDSFLVATFNGNLLNHLLDSGSIPGGAGLKAKGDSINRVAMSARVAKPGQFMFPIPALTLGLDTSSPDTAQQWKKQLVGLGVLGSQLSGGVLPVDSATGGMLSKQIAGTTVSYLASPFGPGLYLATKGNNVFLATDEPGMNAQLSAQTGTGFISGLKSVSGLNAEEPNVANFYINSKRLADFYEGIGGMMAAYSNNNPVTPEMIEAIRKSGDSYGFIQNTDGTLRAFAELSPR